MFLIVKIMVTVLLVSSFIMLVYNGKHYATADYVTPHNYERIHKRIRFAGWLFIISFVLLIVIMFL